MELKHNNFIIKSFEDDTCNAESSLNKANSNAILIQYR